MGEYVFKHNGTDYKIVWNKKYEAEYYRTYPPSPEWRLVSGGHSRFLISEIARLAERNAEFKESLDRMFTDCSNLSAHNKKLKAVADITRELYDDRYILFIDSNHDKYMQLVQALDALGESEKKD